MAYKDFEKRWLGKTKDYDGVNRFQCVDWVKLYVDEELHIKPGAWGSAKNWWLDESIAKKIKCERIPTTVVRAGDIVPLKPVDARFTHRDGHIGIATGIQTSLLVEISEQNGQTGNGQGQGQDRIRKRFIRKNRMYGVLRPTVPKPVTKKDDDMYEGLTAEQQHKIGEEWHFKFSESEKENKKLRDAFKKMESMILELQTQITALSLSKKLTTDQLSAATQKLNELTIKLDNERADATETPPLITASPALQPTTDKPSWIIRALDFLARK